MEDQLFGLLPKLKLKKNLRGLSSIALIIILLLFVFLYFKPNRNTSNDVALISLNGRNDISIRAEIADDEAEREYGLMNRDYLDPNSGMLFVFDKKQHLTFWMKDTLIPLDIIFLDEDGTINTIFQNTIPKNSLNKYNSTKPSKYALELNSGYISSHKIGVGDKFIFNIQQ